MFDADVCIFVHYDRDDLVDPYVVHYLRAIRECGFEIVFVSAAKLPQQEKLKLAGLCADVICRDNVGHDFGSWAEGLARHHSNINKRLLLANDSVYGPIGSLKAALDRLTAVPVDFYGMVLSREIVPHLQSWFLLFEPHVVRSQAFADIFMQPIRDRSRDEVIRNFELKATTHLQAAGFTCRALHESGQRRIVGNPTAYLWRQLIRLDGVPFLKVSIVRDDPTSTINDNDRRRFLTKEAPELLPVIEAHLVRVRSQAPNRFGIRERLNRLLMARFVQQDDALARSGLLRLVGPNQLLFRISKALVVIVVRPHIALLRVTLPLIPGPIRKFVKRQIGWRSVPNKVTESAPRHP